jgi:hypothetical protein
MITRTSLLQGRLFTRINRRRDIALVSGMVTRCSLARGIANQKEQIDNFSNSKDYYEQVRQLAKLQGLTDLRSDFYANKKDFDRFKVYVIVDQKVIIRHFNHVDLVMKRISS